MAPNEKKPDATSVDRSCACERLVGKAGVAATAPAPIEYSEFMKGGEAYEGTKKEHLDCGNNPSVRCGI